MKTPARYLKPTIREVIAHMTDARGKVLKVFLGFSLVGAMGSGTAFAYAKLPWQQALATIALTFTATAFSAALIEISVRVREVWERIALVRQFSALFDYPEAATGSVALVLACFQTKGWTATEVNQVDFSQIIGAETTLEAANEWQKHSLKHLATMHSLGTTMADIEVAMDVIAAISRIGLPAPSVLWDVQAIQEAVRTDSKYTTFISVGLCSNVFSVWAANEKSRRLVMIDSATSIKVGSRIEAADAYAEFIETPNGPTKYGLITRFAIGGGKSAMILGGISALGSTMMSTFLSNNWQSLVSCEDPHNREQIGSADFSAVLEVRRGGVEISDVRVRPHSAVV